MQPLTVDSKRTLFLDSEMVCKLKGMIVLAHHPELINRQIFTGSDNDSFTGNPAPRGIRLDISGVGIDGSPVTTPTNKVFGTQTLQDGIIKALCDSVGSDRLYLTSLVVQQVRKMAADRRVADSLLTDRHIVVSLFNLLARSKRPTAVVLSDALWLFTGDCAQVVSRELADKSSRVVFIAVPGESELEPGQVPPSAAVPVVAPTRGDTVDEPNPGEMPPSMATYLRGLTNQQLPGQIQIQRMGEGGGPQMNFQPVSLSFAMTIRDDGHAMILQPGATSPSPFFQLAHLHATRLKAQGITLSPEASFDEFVQHATLIADPVSGAPVLIFRAFPLNVTSGKIQKRMQDPEFRAYTKV
jgi:hypothetical protein